MPLDKKLFASPASRGDVAGVALDCAKALTTIAHVLKLMASGEKPSDENIKIIRDAANSLDERFEELVGWTSE